MGFLNISWWIWGCAALVVALVYAFYIPKSELVYATKGLQFFIVRWFHSLVWILLAISFLARTFEDQRLSPIANLIAILSGVLYVIFLVALIRLK
ncbi:MAG: hypothetical protein K1X72_16955 [Pyrinomonadaceae bacterium]|nr:hypothetical protein [Pyrinomonadaceae bacterium]